MKKIMLLMMLCCAVCGTTKAIDGGMSATLSGCQAPVFGADSIKNITALTANLSWAGNAASYIVSHRLSESINGVYEDFEDAARVAEVLSGTDILARERGLDALLWERIDSLTVMHVFDLDLILGFAARLQIVNRWLRLDEATGRELFEKMVRDIKANYTLE